MVGLDRVKSWDREVKFDSAFAVVVFFLFIIRLVTIRIGLAGWFGSLRKRWLGVVGGCRVGFGARGRTGVFRIGEVIRGIGTVEKAWAVAEEKARFSAL